MYRPKLFQALKGYTRPQFIRDIIAGVIVGIIALPLSIALAISSGVSPETGLYTAIIAGFLVAVFGGSNVQIGGPTGAFVVIVYGIVVKFGLCGLILATIMAGVILVIMGVCHVGTLIKHVPYSVTAGFTSGIAVVIFSTQVKDLLGLSIQHLPSEFLPKWTAYFASMGTAGWNSILISIIALAAIILWQKYMKKLPIPGSLIAILLASFLVGAFSIHVATIGSTYGEISSSLPKFVVPEISMNLILKLLPSAFTIALLAGIESLLSAVVADSMIDGQTDPNVELVGQGIANIASGFFGGIPATGAIARTAANVKNGGRTPVAGIVHALTLLVILLLVMPYASLIPLSALAAILAVVSYNMGEWHAFPKLWKDDKYNFMVMTVTFFLTVVFDLVVAIGVGMALHILRLIYFRATKRYLQLEVAIEEDKLMDDK